MIAGIRPMRADCRLRASVNVPVEVTRLVYGAIESAGAAPESTVFRMPVQWPPRVSASAALGRSPALLAARTLELSQIDLPGAVESRLVTVRFNIWRAPVHNLGGERPLLRQWGHVARDSSFRPLSLWRPFRYARSSWLPSVKDVFAAQTFCAAITVCALPDRWWQMSRLRKLPWTSRFATHLIMSRCCGPANSPATSPPRASGTFRWQHQHDPTNLCI